MNQKHDAIHTAMESSIAFSCNPEERSLAMEGEIRMDEVAWEYIKVDDEHAAVLFFHNLYVRLRQLGVSRKKMKLLATQADGSFERSKRKMIENYVKGKLEEEKKKRILTLEEAREEDEKGS